MARDMSAASKRVIAEYERRGSVDAAVAAAAATLMQRVAASAQAGRITRANKETLKALYNCALVPGSHGAKRLEGIERQLEAYEGAQRRAFADMRAKQAAVDVRTRAHAVANEFNLDEESVIAAVQRHAGGSARGGGGGGSGNGGGDGGGGGGGGGGSGVPPRVNLDRLQQLSGNSRQCYKTFADRWGHSDAAGALLVKIAAGAREGYLTPSDKRVLKDLLIRAHAGETCASDVLREIERRIVAAKERQQRAMAAFRSQQAVVDDARGFKRKRLVGGAGGAVAGDVPPPYALERVPSGRGGVKQKMQRKRHGGDGRR